MGSGIKPKLISACFELEDNPEVHGGILRSCLNLGYTLSKNKENGKLKIFQQDAAKDSIHEFLSQTSCHREKEIIVDIPHNKDMTLEVFKGNITSLPVDIVVNAANGQLRHGGGVAKAIENAAGQELTADCREQIKRYGKLEVTDHYASSPGCLNEHMVKKVYHAIGPKWSDYAGRSDLCIRDLRRTLLRCLIRADQEGHTSIAFPSISASIFAVPWEICAKGYLTAVKYFEKMSNPNEIKLKNIYFVDINDKLVEFIKNHFDENRHSDISDTDDSFKEDKEHMKKFIDYIKGEGKLDGFNPTYSTRLREAQGRFSRHVRKDPANILAEQQSEECDEMYALCDNKFDKESKMRDQKCFLPRNTGLYENWSKSVQDSSESNLDSDSEDQNRQETRHSPSFVYDSKSDSDSDKRTGPFDDQKRMNGSDSDNDAEDEMKEYRDEDRQETKSAYPYYNRDMSNKKSESFQSDDLADQQTKDEDVSTHSKKDLDSSSQSNNPLESGNFDEEVTKIGEATSLPDSNLESGQQDPGPLQTEYQDKPDSEALDSPSCIDSDVDFENEKVSITRNNEGEEKTKPDPDLDLEDQSCCSIKHNESEEKIVFHSNLDLENTKSYSFQHNEFEEKSMSQEAVLKTNLASKSQDGDSLSYNDETEK